MITRPNLAGFFLYLSEKNMNRKLRIVFMGTPEFARDSLDILVQNGYDVAGVVTAPDNPAGRGRKPQPSAVCLYAKEHGLKVLQPLRLKDPLFLEELHSLNANLQIVVAFRMLPEQVWKMPEYGTFNLHASLLPQYRGAAPMNHAIMNGEKETGLTTFFLKQEIDTGQILFQEKVNIGPEETLGELHDRMKIAGAALVLKTVRAIETDQIEPVDQGIFIKEAGPLKPAPKIFKEDCRIEWDKQVEEVHNKIRGLSPFPGAFTYLQSPAGEEYYIKIYRTVIKESGIKSIPGSIRTDGKSYLEIATSDGILELIDIQQAGKKRMNSTDFLKGFRINEAWKVS